MFDHYTHDACAPICCCQTFHASETDNLGSLPVLVAGGTNIMMAVRTPMASKLPTTGPAVTAATPISLPKSSPAVLLALVQQPATAWLRLCRLAQSASRARR